MSIQYIRYLYIVNINDVAEYPFSLTNREFVEFVRQQSEFTTMKYESKLAQRGQPCRSPLHSYILICRKSESIDDDLSMDVVSPHHMIRVAEFRYIDKPTQGPVPLAHHPGQRETQPYTANHDTESTLCNTIARAYEPRFWRDLVVQQRQPGQ